MDDTIEVLLTEEEITSRIVELGSEITKDYEGKELVFICVMTGAMFFFTELAKRVKLPMEVDFIKVSSYGNDTVSSGNVVLKWDVTTDLKGKDVVIVEDIVDTGNTVHFLKEHFKHKGANSVKICTMLDKPSRREKDVEVDYIGQTIPNAFVVGYGLDATLGNSDKKLYRNLPYVGIFTKK